MPKSQNLGYGKPPKSGQFKPGQSGNPKGRPKGKKNLKTELEEEMFEKVAVKEGGKMKNISKQRAMLKALIAKAVQGDSRAANAVFNLAHKLLDLGDSGSIESEDLSSFDKEILESYGASVIASHEAKQRKLKKKSTGGKS